MKGDCFLVRFTGVNTNGREPLLIFTIDGTYLDEIKNVFPKGKYNRNKNVRKNIYEFI